MKVDPTMLECFVKRASINGTIMTINLDFNDAGLRSNVKDISDVALTLTTMPKTAFEDYEPIGEVFIKNTPSFMKYLKSFKGMVTIEKVEEYILKIYNEKREGYIILGSELVCENIFKGDLPKVETLFTENISRGDLLEALSDVKSLNINQIIIVKKDKKLTFEVGVKGESDYFKTIINTETEGEARTSVGATLVNFYNATSKDFIMKLGNDIPIVLEEEFESIKHTCIIAPMITS